MINEDGHTSLIYCAHRMFEYMKFPHHYITLRLLLDRHLQCSRNHERHDFSAFFSLIWATPQQSTPRSNLGLTPSIRRIFLGTTDERSTIASPFFTRIIYRRRPSRVLVFITVGKTTSSIRIVQFPLPPFPFKCSVPRRDQPTTFFRLLLSSAPVKWTQSHIFGIARYVVTRIFGKIIR